MCNSSANVEKEGGVKPNFLTQVTCFFISPVASQKLDYIFFPLMHTKEIPMMELLLTLTEERFFHRRITQPGDYKTLWQHFSNSNIPVTKKYSVLLISSSLTAKNHDVSRNWGGKGNLEYFLYEKKPPSRHLLTKTTEHNPPTFGNFTATQNCTR